MSQLSEQEPAPSVSRLWSRVTHVETQCASLREDQARTWEELSKLRQAVHPMASSLTALTMLTERAEVDRGRMISTLDTLTQQLGQLVPQVREQGVTTSDHIRDCESLNERKERVDEERHRANQRRLARLEYVYYFGMALAAVFATMLTDPGRRILHHLFMMPPT